MADVRFTDLPAVSSLDGTEVVPVNDGTGAGTTRRTTIADILALHKASANTFTAAQTGPFRDKGGAVYNVKAAGYGAAGDSVMTRDAAITSGTAVLTCASGPFLSTDVGKTIRIFGAGPSDGTLTTTILTYTSATQVTLAANASTTTTASRMTLVRTDDTAAVQAAIDAAGAAGGGRVYFPRGVYCVSGLTVDAAFVELEGECQYGSQIAMTAAVGNTLTLTTTNVHDGWAVRNLRFEPAIDRTSGAEIQASRFIYLNLEDLTFFNCYRCMELGGAAAVSVIGNVFRIRAQAYFEGLYLTRVFDGWFAFLSFDTFNVADGATGIRLDGGNEACEFASIDVVNAHPGAPASANTFYSLRVKAANYTTSPSRWNKFLGCYFDSHTESLIEDGDDNRWTNCWWSSWRFTPLTIIGTASHCSWVDNDSVNGGGHGIYHDSAGIGNSFIGCHALAPNSVGAGGYAIALGANSNGVRVLGCTGNDMSIFGVRSTAGLLVASGATNCTIADCDFSNNALSLDIQSTSVTNVYRNLRTTHGHGEAARVRRTTAQTIPTATVTAISWDAERQDPNGMWAVGNPTRLVARVPGFYALGVCLQFESNGTGIRQISVARYNSDASGATVVAAVKTPSLSGSIAVVTLHAPAVYMSVGQYLEVFAYQDSGGDLDLEVAAEFAPEASLVKVA